MPFDGRQDYIWIDGKGMPPFIWHPPTGSPPLSQITVSPQIPLIPTEFPDHASLAVHKLKDGPTEVKVIPGPMTIPPLTELESYNASEDKIFYLESYDLRFRLAVASALAEDMLKRCQPSKNKELVAQTEALEKAVSELAKQASALYAVAGVNAYPSNDTEK